MEGNSLCEGVCADVEGEHGARQAEMGLVSFLSHEISLVCHDLRS